MLAAMGYLAGGGVLAGVMAMVGAPSEASDADAPTFRYDMSRAWCFTAIGVTLLLTVAWLLAGMALTSTLAVADYSVGWIVLAGLAATYAWCRAYVVTAGKDALVVHGLMGTRSIPYQDIREVVLKEGAGRSGALLELRDTRGKRLLSANASFDYLGLCGIVRARSAAFGVRFRHRDAWGKWLSS